MTVQIARDSWIRPANIVKYFTMTEDDNDDIQTSAESTKVTVPTTKTKQTKNDEDGWEQQKN
jgi:hypothetical protein